MTMAFILDIIIAILLVTTVFYCWRLNQRLSALRKGREELTELVGSLTKATQRAEISIGALKITAKEAQDGLQDSLQGARSLRDELSMITETGNNLADRLENRLTGASRAAAAGRSVDLDEVREARSKPLNDEDEAARAEILKVLQQAR